MFPIVVLEWLLRLVLFFINSWLFVAIYKSGEMQKIYVFIMLYFIIINDCMAYLVYTIHDIPSYFQEDSIFIRMPLLYHISTAILSIQWFFHLFFLPVFSLIHFSALFFPIAFRLLQKNVLLFIVLLLYLLTMAVTVPLFTSCCGFIYHSDFKYWYFDYAKPYTDLYQNANNWLQIICVSVMAFANISIIIRLFRIRRKSCSVSKTSIVVISNTTPDRSNNTQPGAPRRRIRLSLTPEVRLGISFVLLSSCFFISTLSFNFLTGTQSPILMLVNLLCGYLNFTKWIVYSLGNRNIRRVFLSPFAAFTA